jgi:hypothetical protein
VGDHISGAVGVGHELTENCETKGKKPLKHAFAIPSLYKEIQSTVVGL